MTIPTPTTLRAEDQFDRLASERIQEIRKSIKKGSDLEEAINGFDKLIWVKTQGKIASEPHLSQEQQKYVSRGSAPRSISPEDLQRFVQFGASYEETDSFDSLFGIYLSTLIERCPTRKVMLKIPPLKKPITYLGMLVQGKDIEVEGNLGSNIGHRMLGSKLTIRGNAGALLGERMSNGGHIQVFGDVGKSAGYHMNGGLIEVTGNCGNQLGDDMRFGFINVQGNVGSYTGMSMKGGIIEVRGSTGEDVGYEMQGGNIRLYGEVKGISNDIKGGEIWHNDKPIVAGGKFIP